MSREILEKLNQETLTPKSRRRLATRIGRCFWEKLWRTNSNNHLAS